MAINIYSIREMSRPFNQQFTPKTFMQGLFAKEAITHETREFSVDKVTGSRRMSVFTSPLARGQAVRAEGFETQTIKPGYIKEVSTVNPGDTLYRMPGEEIFGDHGDPNERAARELGQRLQRMDEAITRREEYMTATALTTGKVVISEMDDAGNVIDAREVDFGMNSNHLYQVSNLWDSNDANPFDDLMTASQLLAKNSGVFPNVAIVGSDAAAQLIQDDTIQKYLDLQYANLAELRAELDRANGSTRLGLLRGPGMTIELWTYNEWYKDPATGTVTEMMPAKKVLLGNTNARVENHYRVIEDFRIAEEMPEFGVNTMRLRRFAKSWQTENPSARHILLQSGPIVVPVEIDAFACLTVLT